MFKRKIYQELLNWKNISNGNSALLIEGARRVGKTSIAKEFGKNEFPNFKIIDFSRTPRTVTQVFDDLSDIDEFFSRLFTALKIKTLPKGSLFIFDEVQFCPKARQAIKALVEDGRYFYIETGSLVSIKEHTENILIPSEEESVQMYPMDYEEFLWACGYDHQVEQIKQHFNNKKPFDKLSHGVLMGTFRTYLAIGGMPQVVHTYLTTKDFLKVDVEKNKILKTYEEDLRKIDNQFNTICYLVWRQLPKMLTSRTTRFLASSVNQRADTVLFANTMEKLIESKMIIAVYKCNDPTGGFELTKNIGSFKIYFNDVGLFTSVVYAKTKNDSVNIYQRLILDKLNTNLGMLFENVCAQILVANNYEPYYYFWSQITDDKKKWYEIDFIIFKDGKTIPFEVKSSDVSSKKSLEEFSKKFQKRIGQKYIVWSKTMKFEDKLTYLPYYMLFALK